MQTLRRVCDPYRAGLLEELTRLLRIRRNAMSMHLHVAWLEHLSGTRSTQTFDC